MNDPEPTALMLLDRLRRAQAVAQVGSWELDLATRTMWGSEEAFRIYGLSLTPGQVMALPDVQAVPLPEYRARLSQALGDLIAGREAYDVEYRIRRPNDGAVCHIHSLAELGRSPVGGGPVVVGTIQDITARKAMEQAVRDSEARFRMILEHAADAILMGEASGIAEVNQRAIALTGYSRDELVGLDIGRLFAPGELERAPLRYDLLERGEAVTIERLLARKDGSTVPVEMHTVRLPSGTYQAIFRDISERRRLEAQLQLRQRMDSIGTLASGVAHDFNNILVSILGYAELLRAEAPALTAQGHEAVEHVLSAAKRAADLVRRLRTLTRPEPPSEGSFDLHTVVTDVLQVLAETTDRRIRKECSIAPGEWFVRGSASDIYHALINLAVNAEQAIEEKGVGEGDAVRVDVRAHEADDGDPLRLAAGSYVLVSLSDTGAGMTPEVKARAFDPLFSTRSRGARKGQGLGLTMVYNIVVTQHGGAIAVETAEGRGSTFRLYLPCGQRVPATASAAALAADAVHDPATILVVEDEEQIAGLATRVLTQAGYRVAVAGDGPAALERFGPHGEGIDLVILDQTLPRLSGTDVLREMACRRPDVAVIMSSGNIIALPDGAPPGVGFLPKPYSLGDLKSAVRKALARPS